MKRALKVCRARRLSTRYCCRSVCLGVSAANARLAQTWPDVVGKDIRYRIRSQRSKSPSYGIRYWRVEPITRDSTRACYH